MKELFSYLQKTYPLSRPQDMLKAALQAYSGAEHAAEFLSAEGRLKEEAAQCRETGRVENLSEKFCRYHLGEENEYRLRAVAALFSSGARTPINDDFSQALTAFQAFSFTCFSQKEKEEFLIEYERRKRPTLSHSEVYRKAYAPHYRVLPRAHARLIDVLAEIYRRSEEKERFVIAIDGRCAAGKTTSADILSGVLDAAVVRCDDFFIPVEERCCPHEINLDTARFLSEIVRPLKEGGSLGGYVAYDCHADRFFEKKLPQARFIIVEGSYATAPIFGRYYDYSVFVDVSEEEQKKRLLLREGADNYELFLNKWIPLEEEYFSRYGISKRCERTV